MVKARAEHPPIFNITYMASHSFAHLGWKQCCDSSSVSAWQEYWYTEHKKLSTWPIATHIRAAGSNLRIVRPSVVKLPIIHARSAQQNFGLAIFSSQEVLSLHFSFKLEVTINLLQKFTRSIVFHWSHDMILGTSLLSQQQICTEKNVELYTIMPSVTTKLHELSFIFLTPP